jgi:hypothetical protein
VVVEEGDNELALGRGEIDVHNFKGR